MFLTILASTLTNIYTAVPTASEIHAFKPYSYYAATAHCHPNTIFP
jgi:hypothetical protein